jgi:uncharacterized protein
VETLLLIVLTFIASFIGTLTGFGSSTIMLPIVVMIYPLPVALLYVGIIHLCADLWKIVLFRQHTNWKIVLTFGIPGFFASIIGAIFALTIPTGLLALLILYVLLLYMNPKFSLPTSSSFLATGGIISGIMAGLLGIGGPARSMFLAGFKLEKHMYLFVSGITALFIDVVRLFIYHNGEVRLPYNLWLTLIFLIPLSFIAAKVAKIYVDKINQKQFRNIVFAFLFIVGLKLIINL